MTGSDVDEGADDDETPAASGEVLALVAGAAAEGTRLDAFVAAAVRDRGESRSSVQAWLEAGRVRVRRGASGARGEVAPKASLRLREGDEVTIDVPPPPAPPEPLRPEAIPLAILHQDERLLVLDKPAGLTVHPGAGQRTGTLAAALLHACGGKLSSVGGPDRPGIVHRLDKETSGVIVVARDDVAHRALAKQFHDRTVRKTYLALVEGRPPDEGTVDAPIGRHPRDRQKMAVAEGGRAAVSRFRTVERFGPAGAERFALVEVRPETGRTHQIRVHLKHVRCPLLADPTYGGHDTFTTRDAGLPGPDRVLLARHALHALRLELTHPGTGVRMTFEAPLAADLAATLAALR